MLLLSCSRKASTAVVWGIKHVFCECMDTEGERGSSAQSRSPSRFSRERWKVSLAQVAAIFKSVTSPENHIAGIVGG